MRLDALSTLNEYAYGVGHFINDLTAACWFNFLLIYLTSINPIDSVNPGFYAGLVMLSGQVADGLATPFVGYFSDRTNSRFGKRKPWYATGFVIVVVSFLFIFQNCMICSLDYNKTALKMSYYIFFPSLFNIGWAFMQVSHMSLVPSLSGCQIKKDRLNSLRNVFTFFANFFVLIVGLIFFNTIEDQVEQFQYLSYVVTLIGSLASLFFLLNLNERELVQRANDLVRQQNRQQLQTKEERTGQNLLLSLDITGSIHELKLSYWFKQLDFYVYGSIYMLVRMINNIFNSLIQFYLYYVLNFSVQKDKTPIQTALVPLISNVSQILVSFYIQKLYIMFGKKHLNTLGMVLMLFSSAVYWFLTPEINYLVYPAAFLSGISLSISLNSGISFICDVVGK